MEAFFTDYFDRLQDLNRDFIEAFDGLPDQALDWTPGAEMNSFCVLVVHTTASARYWIGDGALGEPSNRVRATEFEARGLSGTELKARFAALEDYVRGALERISFADLAVVKSARYHDTPITGGWALLHALEHTGMHLGHAQITRQLWDQRSG
ncbi:MAG: DinB family protein [Chloroflexota bacterium]